MPFFFFFFFLRGDIKHNCYPLKCRRQDVTVVRKQINKPQNKIR